MLVKKWVMGVGSVGLLGTALVGCGTVNASSHASNNASQSTTKSGVTNVKFVQDFPQPPWVAQIPWDVAQAKGFYKQDGLNVSMVWPSSPSDPLKYVATGKVDMGVSYTPDILNAEANGLKVLAVASLFDQDCGGVMAWGDEIHTPADFKGKTVAIYNIPQTQLEFRTMLENAGVDPSQVHIVSAGNYSVPLMVANKVDGADAAAPMEYVDLKSQTKKPVVFFPYNEKYGIPQRYWFVIVANPTFAKEHPDAVKAFIQATFQGLHYATTNTAEALQIYEKQSKQPDSTVKDAWAELQKYSFKRFYPNKPEGYMDVSIWKGYQKFYVDHKLLTNPVDPSQFVTNTYLPSAK